MGKNNKGTREYKNPTPVKLYIQVGTLEILNSHLRWTLHSLKIFNEGLFLPSPLNFYIHWRSSIRV